VSLTTYPARAAAAAQTIRTLFDQTMAADAICLNLVRREWPGQALPPELVDLEHAGLTIVWTDEDLKPHTKYYETMRRHPGAAVVTVDDDMAYPPDLIATLWAAHQRYPGAVVTRRARRIGLDRHGRLKPYWRWPVVRRPSPGPRADLLATGVGGVLYPPHCLPPEAFDADAIRRLCLTADDLWLKVMEFRQGVPVVLTAPWRAVPLPGSQGRGLVFANLGGGRNDRALRAVLAFYGLEEAFPRALT
jgi:hypothetical protein